MKKVLFFLLVCSFAFGDTCRLNGKFYTDIQEIYNPDDYLVLVNKYKYLPKDYKPSDLVYINGAYGNKVALREIVKDDFIRLQKAAKDELGITLMPTSAYRSYSTQKALYEKYVKQDGKEKADTYSARPGHSEHQTGLAIDLKNMALKKTRLSDENYKWLEENAHKYGFIVRFPKGKEQITGYKFENWHIRYVGKKAAKEIMDNNLTLEEYVGIAVNQNK